MTNLDPAEAAYEAYGNAVGWRSVNNSPLPGWADLGKRVQGGWFAAADAARRARPINAFGIER